MLPPKAASRAHRELMVKIQIRWRGRYRCSRRHASAWDTSAPLYSTMRVSSSMVWPAYSPSRRSPIGDGRGAAGRSRVYSITGAVRGCDARVHRSGGPGVHRSRFPRIGDACTGRSATLSSCPIHPPRLTYLIAEFKQCAGKHFPRNTRNTQRRRRRLLISGSFRELAFGVTTNSLVCCADWRRYWSSPRRFDEAAASARCSGLAAPAARTHPSILGP